MLALIRRLRTLRHVRLRSEHAQFYFAKNVRFALAPGATIEVSGRVTIGYPLPGTRHGYPGHSDTIIEIGAGGRLTFDGDAFIANGAGIYVGDGAHFTFKGNNFVAHNSTWLCKNRITVGKNSSTSWNFIGIDDDGHTFHQPDGCPVPREHRPLVIGDNVAVQVNVVIPHGITIGDNAIIGASTVLRHDVTANTLVYSKPELRQKEGLTYGFQFLASSLK